MATLEKLAKDLHMKPDDLMRESLEVFLGRKLKAVEAELFLLAKRYGVKDVFEFDKMVREGRFHEEDVFEDYFNFDNLEAERDVILGNLEKI